MKWTSSFKYLPINYGMTLATLSDKTQRVLFDNNLNGNKVRILFSNKYAKETLNLKKVTIGIENEGAVERIREVTLRGTKEIVLPAGAEVYSDEVEVTVKAGDRIAVNIYIDQRRKFRIYVDTGQKADQKSDVILKEMIREETLFQVHLWRKSINL